jgi:hypothetical protein
MESKGHCWQQPRWSGVGTTAPVPDCHSAREGNQKSRWPAPVCKETPFGTQMCCSFVCSGSCIIICFALGFSKKNAGGNHRTLIIAFHAGALFRCTTRGAERIGRIPFAPHVLHFCPSNAPTAHKYAHLERKVFLDWDRFCTVSSYIFLFEQMFH